MSTSNKDSAFKAYDIDAIKAKLNAVATKKDSGFGDKKSKVTFWKPELGEHDVRFLPITTFGNENEPFQQVLYYEKFCKPRLIAPFQFNAPDPIKDLEQKLFKEKDRNKRAMLKYLFSKERYYAVLVVRGQEDKGPMLWEMSKELCYQIYKTSFIHKNFKNTNLVDPETGHDFSVTVTPKLEKDGSPATFNGFACKEYTVTPLLQPSKLHETAATSKKLLEGIPNLSEYFKAQVKAPEEIEEALQNFVAQLDANGTATPVALSAKKNTGTGTDLKRDRGAPDAAADKAEAEIAKAFSVF